MFAAILEQFNQGKIGYQDIKEILVSTLNSSPEMHSDITRILNSDSKTQLTDNQYQELLGIVDEITQRNDDGKTRLATDTRLVDRNNNDTAITDQIEENFTTDSDKTVVAAEHDSNATVVSKESDASIQVAGQVTGTNDTNQLKPGDTIKGRFVLEKLIGQGGMGMVFKARDLRKEEAMDSNPYVAVKVLGGAFKEHPQALIALQRESRKAQTLAHPNIVTVFDFDRDGDTAYMTMEYLEGNSLDQVIKEQYPDPFSKEQALRIINGICQGLAYAHSHNIIHADLKPGNVYVTNNNIVKIFDFGIARAMTKKEGDQNVDSLTGETTLFDAGDLGGLTPAYASYEMLTGDDPDTRDDIYALACIAYELLAGKHPFNKLPANLAKERKLTPPAVANISRKQFRGLEHGLSFDRDRRTKTVPLFRNDLYTANTFSKSRITAAIAASIAILVVAYFPIVSYFDNKEIADIVAKLRSENEQTIVATLKDIKALQPDIQKAALKNGKDAVIKYYEHKANQAIDTDSGKFDFESASQLLDKAAELYEDSAQLKDIRSRINRQKNSLLSDLTQRFNRHIDEENLTSNSSEDDLLDTLAQIAKIDSKHDLLQDKRISFTYSQAAEKAANAKNLIQAEQLVMTGLALLPEDTSLINMRDAIEAAKSSSGGIAKQLAAMQNSLEKSITPQQRKLTIESLLKSPFYTRQWSKTLAVQFATLKQKIHPDDPWLIEHHQIIRDTYINQAQKMRKASRFAEAKKIITAVKKITPTHKSVQSEEKRLLAAKKVYDKAQKQKSELARIEGLKKTLLTQARAKDVKGAKKSFQKLRKSLPSQDKFIVSDAPNAIADAYLKLAQNSARRGAYRSAIQLVNAGLKLSPTHTMLQTSLKNYQTKAPKSSARVASKSTDPCRTNFAGHGKRARAICNDILGKKAKGPAMIVIPAGPGIPNPYAISKYEISIADYNLYCRYSKDCQAKSDDSKLPLSNISYNNAKRYVQWLSTTSKYTYRIPTEAEWLHAAKADGKQVSKNFNCQVSLGGNLIKGLSLLNTHSGQGNSWGLTNYIGNVQEWVLAGNSTLTVRGGSYKDQLSNCEISFSRKHKGNADKITGFRLVRQLKP